MFFMKWLKRYVSVGAFDLYFFRAVFIGLAYINDVFLLTWMQVQERNHKFFRAGEFPWNKGTLVNLSSTTQERKAAQGKVSKVFPPKHSWNSNLNGKFSLYMATIRAFSPNN